MHSLAMRRMSGAVIFLLIAPAAASEERSNRNDRRHRQLSRGRRLQHRRRQAPKAEDIQDICINPKAKFNVEETLTQLESNRLKFNNLQNYDMNIRRSCYCYGDALDPYLVSVRDGITVSVTNERTGTAMDLDDYRYRFPTIADLFDIVDAACTKPYANLNVEYDVVGYPRSVGYDKNECIADEENSYTVTNFVDRTPLLVDASAKSLRWRRRRHHQG